MPWTLVYLDEFSDWLDGQAEDLQDEALSYLEMLKDRGPLLSRPYADTLKGSKIANLKELRFSYKGAPIRILFAFDPRKQGVIILGGDKTGDKRWYEKNITIAEKLYATHLEKQCKQREPVKEEKAKKKDKG
ncbi:MAG: type II toxin-antitoxin system RelE/ParE family toxin [Candidatus Obscuribacterales bacterium]|nr:type II toxin-antitoxin system RelE/ParE family toxin [Candidatus Obscuribacterales bacterium]